MGRIRTGADHERFDTGEYFAVVESSPQVPEQKLLLAVLHKAIQDYADPRSTPYFRWWAATWLFSRSREVMSLWWICQAFSEDPDSLRDRVVRKAKQLRDANEKPPTVCFRVDTK